MTKGDKVMAMEIVGSGTQAAYQRTEAIPQMQVLQAADDATPIKAEVEEQSNGRQEEANRDFIMQAVEKMNLNVYGNTDAVFGVHEGTGRVTIKLLDRDSQEVVKEFPPEKTLDMIAKVWELAGLFVDNKG